MTVVERIMRREVAAVIAAVALAFVAVQIPNLSTLMSASTFGGTVAVPSETQPAAVQQAKAARTQDAGAAAQAWAGSLTLIVMLPLMLAVTCYLIAKRAV